MIELLVCFVAGALFEHYVHSLLREVKRNHCHMENEPTEFRFDVSGTEGYQ